MADYVTADRAGPRGTITLSRPSVRNALDGAGWRAIADAVSAHAANPAVRVLVLQSTGEAFCAGGDLDWMLASDAAELMAVDRALAALVSCPKPTVARVHAPAYGGGVGLAAACDVVVAARDARFTLGEVRIGVAPAVISRYLIGRVGGARFRAWALLGTTVEAEDAHVAGLVDCLADPDELDDIVTQAVTALAAGEPEALAAAKRLFPTGMPAEAAVKELARLRARPEFQQGIDAIRAKRPAPWVST